MFGSCLTCQFAKKYADEKTSKKGQLVYCAFSSHAVHINGLCDEYTHDNVKAYAAAKEKQRLCPLPCVECGFTEYAHMLDGMRDKVCGEYKRPALAQQDELFALCDVVKERGATMDVTQ